MTISPRTVPIGYCSSCGSQLWKEDAKEGEGEGGLNRWDNWVIKAIGELLSASPAESQMALHEGFQLAVSDVIRHLGISNTKDLDRAVGFGESTLTQWRRGRGKPRFDYFLLFCFKTGINPKDMLCHSSGEFLRHCRIPIDKRKFSKGILSHEQGFLQLLAIRNEIVRVLSSDDTPKEFSKRLGVGIGFLRYRFPEKSRKIAARYRNWLREKKEALFQSRCEAIRKAVEELEAAQEYPSKGKVFGRIPEMSVGGGKDQKLTNVWKEAIRSRLRVKKELNQNWEA
ncbi:hypothetical protein [Leptospirillum ferrooxidans]|uniref:hypothetical protein n=1 Tax=Leptospirillum ferrooxidans TaxID=180 RepID=UPI0002FD5E9E|nr:hypothetical protein [Leptospirillum ferrooxidans]